jgi:hypothetical protein
LFRVHIQSRASPDVLLAQLGLLLGGSENADAQRFGQVQLAADRGSVVALHVSLVHHTGHGQAEDRLRCIDRVSTGQRYARGIAHRTAATNHLAGDLRCKHVDRPAENGDGHQRLAAHGVDVADGVGGGDAAEVEGVIDDGHEEIGRGNHAALCIERIDRSVVARGIADPQPWIEVLRAAARQDHIQHLGRNLAATTRTVAVLGQSDRLAHGIALGKSETRRGF